MGNKGNLRGANGAVVQWSRSKSLDIPSNLARSMVEAGDRYLSSKDPSLMLCQYGKAVTFVSSVALSYSSVFMGMDLAW